MSKQLPPGAYRDELAAAQTRIRALEERLATRDQGDEHEDSDPVIGRMLEQRRTLERIANRRTNWDTVLLAVLTPLVVVLVLVAWLADPRYVRAMAILAMGGVAMVEALGLGMYFSSPYLTRLSLPQHDAKIAEARRLRAIERGLRALPTLLGSHAPRGRVVVGEAIGEEADEALARADGAHVPRRSR